MMNALLIGNRSSGAGHLLESLDIPGRWILDPSTVTPEDVLGADLIALFGGDGTLQITLSQILRQLPVEQLPPVAVMPFGTTNMNAKALNGSGNRRHAVAALRQAVTTGQFKSQQRSLLQVSFMQDNLSLDKQVEHREYGFFLGVGVIARLVERWDQQRRPGGAINQMRSLMAMVTSLRTASIPTDIRLNGHNYSVYGLLATTLDRLLFGSQPFWGTALGGSLRLTWIESSARNILRHIPAVLRGQAHLQNVPGFASMAADCTSLEFEGPYIIDGEIFYSNAETNAEKLTISRSAPIQWLRLDSS